MRRREITKIKTMNKHQSPERSEDLSREKNGQRIPLSQKRRQSMGGVFVNSWKHLCIPLNGIGVAVSKSPLLIEEEDRKEK
jgi:hypothetical protein